jgi:Family of unknown function (DUF6152)
MKSIVHARLQRALLVVAFSAWALSAGAPTLAHHSFALFDAAQVRRLTGTIKSFQWNNPHVTFTVLVAPVGGGKPQEWNIVTSSPAILERFDWTHDSLKPGDRVSVECNPMSDGSHDGRLHTLYMLDTGRVLKTKLSSSSAAIYPRDGIVP